VAGNCGGGILYCQDFENAVAGELPAGLAFQNKGKTGSYRYISGGVGGSKAIEVAATGSYDDPALLDINAVAGLQSAYVRFFVKHAQAAQGAVNFFVLLEDANSNIDDSSVRLRFYNDNKILWNRASVNDTVSPNLYDPNQANTSVQVTPGQLNCIEIFYDNTNNLLQLWHNDKLIEGLTIDNDRNTGNDSRWIDNHGGFYDVNFRLIRVGWQGQGANTSVYDNIAVSQTRIGCN